MTAARLATPDGDTVFERNEWVVVRPQRQGFLFYNSRTDEMHLIPPDGRAVFLLCDGWRTVDEIADEVAAASGRPAAEARAAVTAFLGKLEARGLIGRTP